MEDRAGTFQHAIDILLKLPDSTGMARCGYFYELFTTIVALNDGTKMLEDDLKAARKEIEELKERMMGNG